MTRLAAALSVVVLALLATIVAPGSPAAGAPQQESLARLELDSLSPRVVTAAGPDVLTVTGEVVNVGDRTLSDLAVRVQRDRPLDGKDTEDAEAAALAALTGTPRAPFVTEFTPLGVELQPGHSSPFRIEVALGAGPPGQALQLTEPGVYPILVNLNGTPEFGGPARLGAVPLLLPVQQPPGSAARPDTPERGAAAPLSIVWPLVATPARELSGPGEPLLIAGSTPGSDPIAAQLAPGGRLDGLLRALQQVVTPGSRLAGALCIGVDPALLDTVSDMAGGYRVATPGGIQPGTGAADARRWLNRLRGVVADTCVLALPYGDPDLVALSRAGLTDLAALAVSSGTRLVRDVLGVQPVVGVSWPADGALDERTLSDLVALDTRAVVLGPDGVRAPPDNGDIVTLAAVSPSAGTPAPKGLLADPLLSAALGPEPPRRLPDSTDGGDRAAVSTRPTGTARPLAAQDAIGALTFRATQLDRRPVLLLPPRRWQVGGGEATELLRTANRWLLRDAFRPRSIPEMAGAASAAARQVELAYPQQVTPSEIPPAVTAEVAVARDVLRELQVATERDPTADLDPAALLDPLRLAMLRGVSTAWRGNSERADELIDDVTSRLDELRGDVRIVAPPGPYTLAASDSPLLITVRNDLPVSMDVTLTLEQAPGLRTGAVGVQLVPARSSRQLVIPAEVVRAGQFSVDARLTTPGGTSLGQPITLQLRSSAFDAVTLALTAGAGAILVLLVTRRIVRRNRERSGRAGAA